MIQEIYTTYSIDPADVIYACTDLHAWSLNFARKYEGIGYKGTMVRRVLDVKNVQRPVVQTNNNHGAMNVNMCVVVEVDAYFHDDIFVDCVVSRVEESVICTRPGKSDVVIIDKNEFGFQPGDHLFARVADFLIPTYRKQGLFQCEPYVPLRQQKDFYIEHAALNEGQADLLASQVLARLEDTKAHKTKRKIAEKLGVSLEDPSDGLKLAVAIADPGRLKGKTVRVVDSRLAGFQFVTASAQAVPTSAEVAISFLVERTVTLLNAIDRAASDFVEEKYGTYFDMLEVLEELQ